MEPAGSAKEHSAKRATLCRSLCAQLRTGANQHQQLLNQPFIKQGLAAKNPGSRLLSFPGIKPRSNNSLHKKL
jgi:hypothetical protein